MLVMAACAWTGLLGTARGLVIDDHEESIDFNGVIRPILANNCFECHGPDEESRKADLRLDTARGLRGEDSGWPAVVPGKPKESPLLERMLSHDEHERMPPPESPRQPLPEEIQLVERWIAEGADFEEHWAFVPPRRGVLPAVADENWGRNEIDRFVLNRLEKRKITPRPDAEPGVLARRLSLALTGLPLQPEQTERFGDAYAADADAAVEELVDELLASAAYAEHFAWAWMDAARYADTNGYQADGPRVMWPWRDWLIEALHENISFDEMTRQMLAGDLLIPLETASWESADWIADERSSDLVLATGFLRNHRYDTGSGTIPAESKFENAADRMETVGTVFMGLTMQCARCHSHKYDPIAMEDYYQLLSFFDKVPEVGSALKNASHPYIRTPSEEGRYRLLGLAEELEDARIVYERASGNVVEQRRAWEEGLRNDSSAARERVRENLQHRYAVGGMVFDGKRSVKKGNEAILLCAGNREWAISFWFKPTSATDGAIFSSVEEPERYRPGIQADWVDGKVRVRHVCRWVNSYIEFESSDVLEPGKWYHVSFSCDGRMQGLAYRASLNGVFEGMICTHPVTNDSAEKSGKAPLVLGGSPLMDGFRGHLRDLRFYDRELMEGEVYSLADSRSTAELANIPEGKRSERERETLRLAFLESGSAPAAVRESKKKLLAAEMAMEQALAKVPTTMVMKDELEHVTKLHLMGAFDRPAEDVRTAVPGIFAPIEKEDPNRDDLARWLMDPEHPLTARVSVNRLWQMLWGKGFVDSPENFGTQCARPAHARLMDWLATEYIRLGWDTKALLKLMVTSRAYRQDSAAPEGLWGRDPDNRLYARGPRFRLAIHAVRDQALALSGRLDATIGGPPVLLDEVKGKDGTRMRLPYDISDRRRTIYSFWKRNSPHPMLAVFDVADRNQCDVRVRRTNTPLQALVTLNEDGLVECARDLAKRARASGGSEVEQLCWVYLACTGREPSEDHLELLVETLNDYRELAAGEEPNGVEDSAWAALCNMLLNLDVTLSLE